MSVESIKAQLKLIDLKIKRYQDANDTYDHLINIHSQLLDYSNWQVGINGQINPFPAYNSLPASEQRLYSVTGIGRGNYSPQQLNTELQKIARARIDALQGLIDDNNNSIALLEVERGTLFDLSPDESKQAQDELNAENRADATKRTLAYAIPYIIAGIILLVLVVGIIKFVFKKK